MTIKKYLELSVYNDSKEKKVIGNLNYKGLDLSEGDNYTKVNIWKWNIICNNFPTWLPSIRNPKLNTLYKPYVPNNVPSNSVYYVQPQTEYDAPYFLTDWSITIKYASGFWKPYTNRYVQFLKPKSLAPSIIDYDNNGEILERFMLDDRSKFFWGNATLLCNMVKEAMNAYAGNGGLTNADYGFIKNGSGWTILTKVGLSVEKIYFNEYMRRFFDFPYDYDGGIVIDTQQITTLNNIDYYATHTEKTNSYLFPFRNVLMTFDNGLNVFPQYVSTNKTESNINPTDNILTKFTINVTDINQIGNIIEYSTETDLRALSITDSTMKPFTIYIFLETAKKNLFQLELEYLDEINLLFMIS